MSSNALHDPASKSYSGDLGSRTPSAAGQIQVIIQPSISERFGNMVNGFLQKVFGSIGYFCASRPYLTMTLVTIFVACMSVGIIKFEQENREEELWVPRGSIVLEHAGFYASAFAPEARGSKVILVGKDSSVSLLEKASLLEALQIHQDIVNIQADVEGQVWNYTTLCERNKLGNCLTESILSLWNFDLATLQADPNPLTTVQTTIPSEKINVWLGGIQLDASGVIISASAFRFGYTLANRARFENGNLIDPPANEWEGQFLEFSLNGDHPYYTMYPEAERSFQDEFGGAVNGDIVYLGVSFVLIIFYVCLVLGEFSLVRSRVLLSMAGITSIGFAVATSFGISSIFGFKYNYVHSLMPFLLLAVGVDNIFILVNAFEATNPLDSIPDRAAEAMSHAGVSITVTSLTNFTAFVIGTTTSLPALSSFCFYTAMAILFLYIYQVTFLCACVSLDERRILSHRVDCCLCCTVKEVVDLEKQKKRGKLNLFMEEYWAKFLLQTPVKILVVAIAIGLLAFSITGILKLEIQDATSNFIPQDSYIKETGAIEKEYFVILGTPVDIVTQTIPDYFESQDALASITPMQNSNEYMEPSSEPTYKSWYDAYLLWLSTSEYQYELDDNGRPTNRVDFYTWLYEFLLSSQGEDYRGDVVYAPNTTAFIRATRIRSSYIPLESPTIQVNAMESLRESCDSIAIPTFPWTYDYITWEQNAVVSQEIYVNLALSMLTIFIISFILIANPLASLLVLGSVALTVADILGIMHYWGLSVDSVTAVNLVLAVGFSVDYTAHIAHCFMLQTGSRESRVTSCLGDIGISVINGAFSTFLAILVLAFSSSYVFVVFFKQFFLVCILGVFHGLALLPVVLSWIGPSPYASIQNKKHGYSQI